MANNSKPHLRLTRAGWHAKSGTSNAVGKTPQEALQRLNDFINSQGK